jgi:hypothetical protein
MAIIQLQCSAKWRPTPATAARLLQVCSVLHARRLIPRMPEFRSVGKSRKSPLIALIAPARPIVMSTK